MRIEQPHALSLALERLSEVKYPMAFLLRQNAVDTDYHVADLVELGGAGPKIMHYRAGATAPSIEQALIRLAYALPKPTCPTCGQEKT